MSSIPTIPLVEAEAGDDPAAAAGGDGSAAGHGSAVDRSTARMHDEIAAEAETLGEVQSLVSGQMEERRERVRAAVRAADPQAEPVPVGAPLEPLSPARQVRQRRRDRLASTSSVASHGERRRGRRGLASTSSLASLKGPGAGGAGASAADTTGMSPLPDTPSRRRGRRRLSSAAASEAAARTPPQLPSKTRARSTSRSRMRRTATGMGSLARSEVPHGSTEQVDRPGQDGAAEDGTGSVASASSLGQPTAREPRSRRRPRTRFDGSVVAGPALAGPKESPAFASAAKRSTLSAPKPQWKFLHQTDAMEFFTSATLAFDEEEGGPGPPAPGWFGAPAPAAPRSTTEEAAIQAGGAPKGDGDRDGGRDGDIRTEQPRLLEGEPLGDGSADDDELRHLDQVVQGGGVWRAFSNQLGPAENEYVPLVERWYRVRDIYYTPGETAVPVQDRLPDGVAEPRYREEEGFYVGLPPEMPWRQQLRLEQRLKTEMVAEGSHNWFGEDGRLCLEPDPVLDTPMRALPRAVRDLAATGTVFKHPVLHLNDRRFIGNGPGGLDLLGPTAVDAMDTDAVYQLDVDIGRVSFVHHPLCTEEHRLAAELTSLSTQVQARLDKRAEEFHAQKLGVLKAAFATLKAQVDTPDTRVLDMTLNQREEVEVLRQRRQRLGEYRRDIRATRQALYTERKTDLALSRAMISRWNRLKAVRAEQGFVSTPVSLVVYREEADAAEDKATRKREVKEAIREARERFEVEMAQKQRVYQERQARRFQDNSSEREGDDVLPANLTVPFDQNRAKAEALEAYTVASRPIGEPIYTPELRTTPIVTPLSACPVPERRRREQVAHYEVFVKVLFNTKDVFRTAAKPLREDFSIDFDELYSLRIAQWPTSLTLQLFEAGSGALRRPQMLVELYLPIPDSFCAVDTAAMETYQFSCDPRGRDGGTTDRLLVMSGEVTCRTGWAADATGTLLCPPQPMADPGQTVRLDAFNAIGATGVADVTTLKHWLDEAELDPNDPRNAELLHVTNAATATTTMAQQSEFFRLEHADPVEAFLDERPGAGPSKRERILCLRGEQVPEFRNFAPVPLLEHEIFDSAFDAIDAERARIEPDLDMEDFRKTALSEFLSAVRQKQLSILRQTQQQISVSDVVNEEGLPDLGTLGAAISSLCAPKRPLRPRRRPRRAKAAAGGPDQCVLLVRIERAFEVPQRSTPSGSTPEDTASPPDVISARFAPLVQPVVEVSFQSERISTNVGHGSNASWNEEMELPFLPPNLDFSPDALKKCNDDVSFSLFDEVTTNILQDDRESETNVHQRRERRWLGSFTIPFATVYLEETVSGTFKVQVPPVLLGYEKQERSDVDGSSDTYLSVFVTLEPPLRAPPPLVGLFESSEDRLLLNFAKHFMETARAKFPRRYLRTTCQDINAMVVFVTRYLRAQRPPQELLTAGDTVRSMFTCARFVSCIPFLADSFAFIGSNDMWTTSDQFLQMLGGDVEEHAILLCNFFLFLEIDTCLVLGRGQLEGNTIFVLSKHEGRPMLWDATSGNAYDINDPFCPLSEVGSVIRASNVWLNKQQYVEPSRINWDLTSKGWTPFFNKKYPNPGLSSVQVDFLQYVETLESNTEKLQATLREAVVDRVEELRPRFVTRWNRFCSTKLLEVARLLEEAAARNQPPPDVNHYLSEVLATHQVWGFPLQMPFESVEKARTAVENTGIHLKEGDDVEFALGVYVHPYPNNIFSVWIYLATLTKPDPRRAPAPAPTATTIPGPVSDASGVGSGAAGATAPPP